MRDSVEDYFTRPTSAQVVRRLGCRRNGSYDDGMPSRRSRLAWCTLGLVQTLKRMKQISITGKDGREAHEAIQLILRLGTPRAVPR